MVQQGGVIVVKDRAAAAAAHILVCPTVAAEPGDPPPYCRCARRLVGAVLAEQHLGRSAAQGPEGILQSLLQGQEGLAGGDLGVAPPRVAEYQLEQQVGVGLSGDGHPEFPAVGEVELGLPSRRMHLGEVHLLIRPVQRPPPEPAEGL